ncbi:CoA transferase [Myxococcota bacterium]|nr:CoA transferase [Myxococcota bacterium]
MSRPLDGLRVLDLTRLLPGPFASLLLADLGATVLKVEDTQGGDYARYFPPLGGRMSAVFAALNRDKTGIALDLKQAAGREVLLRLVDRADVLLESFRPGVMDRLGLGADALAARNPRLVYCSISGYGQDSPLAHRAGHDFNYLALAGLAGVTGVDGRVVLPGIQVADIAGGALYPVIGVLAALNERTRTGLGRRVDAAMTDGVAGLGIMLQAKAFAGAGIDDPGADELAGALLCYRPWRCADGRTLAVAALEPKFWAAFCAAVGRPELASDGYATGARKVAVEAELERLFASRTRDEWTAFLAAHDCCVEPVLSLEGARESPHARARGLFGTHAHPGEGATFLHVFPNPALLPGAEPPVDVRPAPRLGEHTRTVLAEAGYTADEITSLLATGAAVAAE